MPAKQKDEAAAPIEKTPAAPGYFAPSQESRDRRSMIDNLRSALESASQESSHQAAPAPAYIGFQLGEFYYAAPLESVIEVHRPPRLVPAPNAPEIVQGVTNLRGEIVCLIDPRRLLGLPPESGGAQSRLLRVRGGSRGIEAAIIVDSAYAVGPDAKLSAADSKDPKTPRLLSMNQLLDTPPCRRALQMKLDR